VRPYLEKAQHKTGLVVWLKVKTLNSSPSIAINKKKRMSYRHDSCLFLNAYGCISFLKKKRNLIHNKNLSK
jgi:hypothetical protein